MKERKSLSAVWIGAVLAIVTAALYVVFYGKPSGNMDNMAWPAVWLLVCGGVLAAAASLIKKTANRRLSSAGLHTDSLAAVCLSVLSLYFGSHCRDRFNLGS